MDEFVEALERLRPSEIWIPEGKQSHKIDSADIERVFVDYNEFQHIFQKYNAVKAIQDAVPTDAVKFIFSDSEDDICGGGSERVFIFGDLYKSTTGPLLHQIFEDETVKLIFSFGCSRECLFVIDSSSSIATMSFHVDNVFDLCIVGSEYGGGRTLTIEDACNRELALFVGIVFEICIPRYEFKFSEYLQQLN